MTQFEISEARWSDWEDLYSGQDLSYDKAKGVVTYEGKTYVITGVGWFSQGQATSSLTANEVVPLSRWEGPSRLYAENQFESQSYKGERFQCKGEWWVCTGNVVHFIPIKVPEFKQKGLF